jgi:hypothetical protein
MPEQEQGFFGRWARRKNAQREGQRLDDASQPSPALAVSPLAEPLQPTPAAAPAPREPAAEVAPVPSLEDARRLTPDSDFKPFMGRAVEPEVRNAAMKQLFSDPHFNVMDGLDIYIDDYSKPDPLPLSMLRQMASAKFLNLFEDDEDQKTSPPTDALAADTAEPETSSRETAHASSPDSMAQSAPALDEPGAVAASTDPIRQEDHADPDLRLQPDHAATAPDAGRCAS